MSDSAGVTGAHQPKPGSRYVGAAVPRSGDARLLRGAASYVADMRPEGCLHAVLLRSPFPHAAIRGYDLTEALAAPGVKLIATGPDVHRDHPALHTEIGAADIHNPDRPLLALGKARFAGEAVVAVMAETQYLAEDAAGMVVVDWEPLDPVVDVSAAVEAGAPQVHDGVPGNVYSRRQAEFGDVVGAVRDADFVIEREIAHPRIIGAPMECRGVVAVPDRGRVTVWSSAQSPHMVHEAIARVLGLDAGDVNVIVPDVGGGFGLKGHVYPEEILIPWLALKTGRPVRWIEDRLEHMTSSNHSRDQRVGVRMGLSKEGKVLGLEARVVSDGGAYGVHPMGPQLDLKTCSGLIPGPYDIRNYAYDSSAVVTNKTPGGAFRGVGMTTAVLVHERMMDIAAATAGIDPAEIRRRNLVPAASMPYTTVTSHPYESGDFDAALEAALRAFGYEDARRRQAEARAAGRAVGIGIASYVEVTAGGSRTFKARGMIDVHAFDSARTWLDRDGLVHVQTTCPDIGQGTHITMAQVAADAVGVDLDLVTVEHSESSKVAVGFGTGMSRSSVTGATAAHRAGLALRGALLEAGAWRLDVPQEKLVVDGRAVRAVDGSGASVTLAELAAAGPGELGGVHLDTEASYDPEQASHPFATHACMVEVDRETGAVRVLRYVVAEDCGRVINPLIVDGQIQGGVAQGVGSALLEELKYSESGQLVTASFMDYLLPTAGEAPEVETVHLETPSPVHELGTKGTGEGGTIASPAAIANAVSDALGVEANTLPLSPERVRSLLDGMAATARS